MRKYICIAFLPACHLYFSFWWRMYTSRWFYYVDPALRLAPLVCIIEVSPHRKHKARVYYGVLFQYIFLNLQVPVSIQSK